MTLIDTVPLIDIRCQWVSLLSGRNWLTVDSLDWSCRWSCLIYGGDNLGPAPYGWGLFGKFQPVNTMNTHCSPGSEIQKHLWPKTWRQGFLPERDKKGKQTWTLQNVSFTSEKCGRREQRGEKKAGKCLAKYVWRTSLRYSRCAFSFSFHHSHFRGNVWRSFLLFTNDNSLSSYRYKTLNQC